MALTIEQRTLKGIHRLTPGLTGGAQINGRDKLSIPEKVEYDNYYLLHRSISLDIKFILQTALKVIFFEGVSHRLRSDETQWTPSQFLP